MKMNLNDTSSIYRLRLVFFCRISIIIVYRSIYTLIRGILNIETYESILHKLFELRRRIFFTLQKNKLKHYHNVLASI
jgi:hypothetical protein